MNTHEAERIADAMNRLRPDWPVKSLRTLLAKPQLAERARRDVTVALAWVACESGTATPARVLEAGPWWRAAAVEGQANRREPYDASTFCGTCSEPRDRCERKWPDHEFVSADRLRAETVLSPEATHTAIAALKASVVEMTTTPSEPPPVRGESGNHE